ncbi:MAG: caspase family protein, partial [Alcanivorax nanhaiticus]
PPVFVYYSGHGAPSLEEDGKAYLVPVDATLRDLTYDGYPLDDFYASIAALPSNNVTVVIDSCFSGSTNDGLLQKDISPAMLKVADTITPIDMGNASVFTSTSPSQVSYWYNEARHSLFTYYFLKGLRGSADGDSDQRITSGELHEYLSWNVANYILEANKPSDQTPQLVGDSHRVMAVYAGAR